MTRYSKQLNYFLISIEGISSGKYLIFVGKHKKIYVFPLSEKILVDYEQPRGIMFCDNIITTLLQLLPFYHVQVFTRNLCVVNL